MLIPVIYFDSTPGKVRPEELEGMIQRRLIMAFRRSSGWVRVGGDPVRGRGKAYKGPERRRP